MAPLIALLAKFGLPLLANAVMTTGKDIIEEKLGVDIGAMLQSPEGQLKLKQLELDHEQFLLDMTLQEKKLYVEDTKSARMLGIELSKSTSWLNQNIMPVLAIATMVGGTWMLLGEEDADVRMAAVSMMTMVLGYFFGSSKGSKDKQELLSKMEQK